MGATATNLSAGNKKVEKFNIGAAVSLHPRKHKDIENPRVPILYTAGQFDFISPAKEIKKMYEKTEGVPAVYINRKWQLHRVGNVKWHRYTGAFFDCHLKNDKEGCDVIYGTD